MADCPNRRLDVHLNQAHFGDTNVNYFELPAKCEVCGVDMTFPGVPDAGQSPDKPMVNIDATEIRFPVIALGGQVEGQHAGFTLPRDRSGEIGRDRWREREYKKE